MAALSADLKSVFKEIGNPAFIVLPNDLLSEKPEYLDIGENNSGSTSAVTADIASDTKIAGGDVLQIAGSTYLVGSKTPELFQGHVISYSLLMYLVNLTGKITRPMQIRDTESYEVQQIPIPVIENAYGYVITGLVSMTSPLSGDKFGIIGAVGADGSQMFLPESYGVQMGDRFEVSASEVYRISGLRKSEYPGVVMCDIARDTR